MLLDLETATKSCVNIRRLVGERHHLFRPDRVGTSIAGAVKPQNRTQHTPEDLKGWHTVLVQ